jgi:nitroreductase
MLQDLIEQSRSCRRFYENEKIPIEYLKDLVNLARLSPSASNLQPLKYILSDKPEKNAKIFRNLSWAAYLTHWQGPAEGERPSAYIIILGDTSIVKSFNCDHGIAAQTILLGACEKGLRGCIVGSINRQAIHEELNIDTSYKILLVIALGKPKEIIVLEKVKADGDIRYWRDKDGKHHVPKRNLEDIILSE